MQPRTKALRGYSACRIDTSLHLLMHQTQQSIIIIVGNGVNKQKETGGYKADKADNGSMNNCITGSNMESQYCHNSNDDDNKHSNKDD